ncbi:MAG: hypothetical protein GIX01_12705 [Candidatus Eremiobacteraeota bacterium]|nr:hypothetical protein [Candidatus Eremiobacteraeota bacterium]
MSAFRDHFWDKYFSYRRQYVAHVVRVAPQRGSLAFLSEIARLGFMVAGNLLCAVILWALTAGAAGRTGGFGLWPVVFGLCALVPTLFVALATGGLCAAVADRRRVQSTTTAP